MVESVDQTRKKIAALGIKTARGTEKTRARSQY
jgi:hypothetical protein